MSTPEKNPHKKSKKEKLKNIAMGIVTAGALGATTAGAFILSDAFLPKGIDNPIPFPVMSQSTDDLRYYGLDPQEKQEIWNENLDNLSDIRKDLQITVQKFLDNTIGTNVDGTYPDITRLNYRGYSDDVYPITGKKSLSSHEIGLSVGSLQDVTFNVRNNDSNTENDYTLTLEVGGLFMSPHRSRFDLLQSQISQVGILDADAFIYDGKVTIARFYSNPNGGMDVVIFRGKYEDVPEIIFDSRNIEIDLNRSPNEVFVWTTMAKTFLTDVQEYYGFGAEKTPVNSVSK